MKKSILILFAALTALCSLTFAQNTKLNQATHPSIDEMKSRFVNPGRDYATAPLWVWNDLLTDDQIRHTMQDLAAQNVKQVFVHPRPGLMTPYLSEDWFHLWRTALDKAEKLDMNVWIYDENSYPTGFAGGLVPEAMPDSRGKGLSVFRRDAVTDANGNWTAGPDIVYVVQVQADGSKKDLSQLYHQTKTGKLDSEFLKRKADGVTWLLGQYKWAGASQWYGGMYYVDLMKPGVTEKFIEITHEAYKKHIGDQFGKRCPGIFSDEAQITPAGHLSWTDDLPEVFEKQHGYSIVDNMNSLVEEAGDWRRVRHDYYQTLCYLFTERWGRPVHNWCEANGMQWTGHYWEHGWPNAAHGPDNMAMYYWHQRPAIDMLMNTYSRDGGQFGNSRAGRELSSVAHQNGLSRTLSENYGAGGWDIRFEDLKRLGDWSYAVGVNTTDEHLSYITIRGARKHDHPQSFSYHSPCFEQYKHLADYWTRLSYMLSSGELTDQRFLLIEPTTTAWMYQRHGNLGRIGNVFRDTIKRLEELQADYDIGSEYVIEQIGRDSDSGKFVVGKAQYDYVVLPDTLENIDVPTLKLLNQYVKKNGKVVSLGGKIAFVEGVALDKQSAEIQKTAENVTAAMQTKTIDELDLNNQPIRLVPETASTDTFHMLRQTENAFILFICNASMDSYAKGKIQLDESLKGANVCVEQFDPFTGKISAYSSQDYDIPPCGSLLLTFTLGKKPAAAEVKEEVSRVIVPTKDWTTKRLDDNALLIDYMDVQIGNETHRNQYFYPANAWLWQKNGFPKSPWDNGVQLRDTLLKHQFADNSGFTQTYRFTVAEGFKPGKLQFVCENPTGYHVTVNETPVDPIPGAWKFDRSFGVYDIAQLVKAGENVVTLTADKMTIFHEIMPAWVVGEFSLDPAAKGFVIVPDRGLQAPKEKEEAALVHSNALEGVSWLNSGCDFINGVRDLAPAITFTFPAKQTLTGIRVWNYNEINLETRGVKQAELFADGVSIGTFSFKKDGSTAETILFEKPVSCKELTFKILSNWKGVTYPLDESFVGSKHEVNGNDNAFVGLSEVQFLTNLNGKEAVVPNVSASATTELNYRGHNRLARYAVNGAGLETTTSNGWAGLGAPFYSGAVDYTQTIAKTAGKTVVQLPPIREGWNGAVAVVLVDGEKVGTIALKYDSVDITSALKDGENDVTVRIYGTPKNLYGPHHSGRLRGSAWPGSFHGAPATMPAGVRYDVIPYGLFK